MQVNSDYLSFYINLIWSKTPHPSLIWQHRGDCLGQLLARATAPPVGQSREKPYSLLLLLTITVVPSLVIACGMGGPVAAGDVPQDLPSPGEGNPSQLYPFPSSMQSSILYPPTSWII